MNEQQIQRAFELFQDRGYTGDMNHFRGLVANNQDAANDARDLLAQDSPVEKKSLFESPIIEQEQEPPTKGGASKPAAGSSVSQRPSVFAQPLIEQRQPIAGPLTEETAQEPVKPKQPAAMPTGRQLAMENVAPAEKQPIPVQTVVEEKPKFVSPEFRKSSFNKSLQEAVPEVFAYGSSGAKEKLDYYFSDYGFKFEQDGDTIKAIAPNGKEVEIDISKENTPTLKRFISMNAPVDSKLVDMEKSYGTYTKKLYNEQDKINAMKRFSDETSNFNKMFEEYMKEKEALDLLSKKISPENVQDVELYQQRVDNLNTKRQQLVNTQDNLKKKEADYKKNLGEYAEMKSEQGGWLKASVNMINETMGDLIKGVMLTGEFLGKPIQNLPTREGSILDLIKKGSSEEVAKESVEKINQYIEGVKEGSGVAPEWMEKRQEGTFSGAMMGLVKIAPLLVASVVDPAIGAAAWYSEGVGAINNEIEGSPEFKDIPREEKYLISMPFGIVAAAIGEIGGAFKAGNEAVIKTIANAVLEKTGKDVTVSTFKELTQNYIKSAIAKGALIVSKDGSAHFATGATMYVADELVKDIYNRHKDKQMFKTPESLDEYVKGLVKSGTAMAIGGLMMEAPKIMADSYRASNYEGVSDETIEIIRNFSDDLEVRKVLTPELTKQEIEFYDKAAGLLKSLPDDYTPSQIRKSIGILQEKTNLENAIKGKDPATVKDKQARIDEINNQLEQISKTKEDAIQEQATDEGVLRQEGPQVELQKVGEGNQVDQVPTEKNKEEIVEEETTKALSELPADNILDKNRLAASAGLIIHASDSKIDKLDTSKSKGGVRGIYGNGIYFTDSPYKASDYGGEFTYLDKSKLSIIDTKEDLTQDFIDSIKKAAKKADENGEMIKGGTYGLFADRLQSELNKGLDIDTAWKSIRDRFKADKQNDWQALLKDLGYDTIRHGYEYVIFDSDKGNTALVESPESHISKSYHEGTNPELVKSVDELIGKRPTGKVGEPVLEATKMQEAQAGVPEGTAPTGEPAAKSRIPFLKFSKILNASTRLIKSFGAGEESAANYINKDGVEVTIKDDSDGGYVNGEQVQGDIMLDFIGNDSKRGEGLASKELDKILNEADKNDMSVSLVVDSEQAIRGTESKRGLTNDQLKKWYESKGFIFDRDSRYGYRPKASEGVSKYKKAEYVSKEGEINNENLEFHSSPQDLQESLDQGRLKDGTFHEDGDGYIYKVENGKLLEVKNVKYTPYENNKFVDRIEYSKPVKETFEQRATRLADKIRNAELPTWLEGIKPQDGETIVTKGVTIQDIKMKVADAVVEIGKLMDTGVAMADAVKQYVDDLVKMYGESNRRRIEDEMLREMSKINDVTRLEGYEDIMKTAEGTIENLRKQGLSDEDIMSNVMTELTKSEAYKKASDIQMEDIVRDIREKFGLKEKKAPTAEKITGTKAEEKKVTITEKSGLKNQIRSLARGAKDAVAAVKQAGDYVAGVVKDAQGKGKVGVKQAAAIAKRVAKTNMLNSKQVGRLVDYIEKVFADADYGSKLSEASGLRRAIRKLSKGDKVDAFTKMAAREFSKIDPRMIEDLAAYKETAESLRAALKGSSLTKGEVSIAKSADLQKTMEFIEAAKAEQMDKMMAEARETIEDMFGIDPANMTYAEMLEMIKGNTEQKVVDEAKIKEDIENEFNNGREELNHILENGTDTEGMMDYDLTASDRKMLKEFSEMDTKGMSDKDALAAIDALNSFIENGTKARMRDILARYKGERGSVIAKAANLIGRAPKFFGNNPLGRYVGKKLFNKPLLIENMFRGFYKASKIEKLMGFTDTSVGKNTAVAIHKKAVNDYVKEFYKLKPNGNKFNTQANIIERGMYAFMTRTVTGTPEAQKAEFNRRKGLVEQSIKWLSEGTASERKMAEVYQEVYDKLVKDSESRDDVWSKTDATNVDAVEFWVNKWAENRDIMSDISEGVYNTILENDVSFTPDRYAQFEEGFTPDIINELESAFFGNSGMKAAQKKAGSLMETSRPDKLPTRKSGEPSRYVNLSFDNVNSSAFRDAMIDVNTAEGIRQMDAFINSPRLKEIIPNGDDRALFSEMIKNYAKEVKNVNIKEYDQFDLMTKSLDKVAKVGSAAVLASLAAPLKQTLPVLANTMVNTNGRFDFLSYFDKDKQNFINESGYAIANRGLETMSNISSFNRSLKAAEEGVVSNVAKAPLKLVEGASDAMLKNLVGKPDIVVARASWLTYYEKYVRDHPNGPERGEVKNIQWDKPETINKDAADYAQKMVDRQQNISDRDMQGELFSSKSSATKFISKALFSFATFRMNQLMRFHTDMTVLASKTTSAEDRAIAAKSLAGFGAEMAVFRATAYWTAGLVHRGILQLFGVEETEEEKERFEKGLRRNMKTSVINDLISPIPLLDPYVASAINTFYYEPMYEKQLIDKADQELLYGETKQEFTKFFGSLGIPFEKAGKIYDLFELAKTGEYEDQFGNKKQISDESQELLKSLKPWAVANMFGIMPVEMQTTINTAMKLAKRKEPKKEEPSKSFLKEYYPEEYKRKYPLSVKPKKEKEQPKFLKDRKPKKKPQDNRFITSKKARGKKFLGD